MKQIITPSVLPEKEWHSKIYTTHVICGHTDLIQDDQSRINLLKEASARNHKRPDIKVLIKDHLTIYRVKKRDWCDSCRHHQFLGIRGQNIVVLKGTPRKPGPVREILKININKLPASERDDLIRGIPFQNDKEKLQIIEGLSEL
jgi:hypothetical protein